MDTGAILVGIAIVLVVGAYVTRPLFEGTSEQRIERRSSPRQELITRRDALYALIRELDDDLQTGKVTEQDYQVERKRLVAEGVAILKQLDELPEEELEDLALTGVDALDAEIEAAVRALRQKPAAPEAAPARFCTQCGRRASPEDRFCGGCGAPLKEVAAQ